MSLTLGVIADSHIPDRMAALPPQVFEALQGVAAILHAGDVCAPRVLEQLSRIAPVHAVAGNADFGRMRLPLDRVLEFDSVRVGLTHGHGGWRRYLWEKVVYQVAGYNVQRYVRLARARFDNVQAIVFGHTHRAIIQIEEGVLMFNPGSLGPDYFPPNAGPAVGLLRIATGVITPEIVPIRLTVTYPSHSERPAPSKTTSLNARP